MDQESKTKLKKAKLHNDLLYSRIAIDFLFPSDNNAKDIFRFRAKCKTYLEKLYWDGNTSIHELLNELEQKGLVDIGNYVVLKDIVNFNKDIVREIEKVEEALQSLGVNIMRSENVAQGNEGEVSPHDKLKMELREKYDGEIEMIQASPLQDTSKLPMDKLYSPVSIREDMEYKYRGRNMGRGNIPGKRSKPVEGPQDLFLIDGKNTKNIFMIGDAGFGKSVFCLRIIKYWLGQNSEDSQEEKEWVHFLQEFSFLFLVRLRRMDSSQTDLRDMICNDLFTNDLEFHDTIRDVLGNKDCRCLVLIDGLDEAKFETGFLPTTIGMTNCTFFWTMRPWKLDEFSYLIRVKDRVVEIHGLTDEGVQIITKNILVYLLGSSKESPEYQYIKEKTQDSKHKPIMKIPLMAMTCIELWYEKKSVGESMTSLYMALLDLLIKRAIKEQKLSKEMQNYFEKVSQDENVPSLPLLFKYDNRKTFIPVLLEFGRVAYDDLSSGKPHLVFLKSDLERVLGQNEFLFGLTTGILSKCEAAGCGNMENVSVNFFHKSIQEFLAAIYIQTNEKVKKSFCSDRLNSVKKIMELENVLIFLSGLDPSNLGIISKYIVSIVNSDSKICLFREFRDVFHRSSRVELLYEMMSRCFRENRNEFPEQKKSPEFHVSDINIHFDSDKELIKDTRVILNHYHEDVKSFWIVGVPNDDNDGISDTTIYEFLSHAKSLQSLYINSYRSNERFIHVVPQLFASLKALVLIDVALTASNVNALCKELQLNTVLQTFGLRSRPFENTQPVPLNKIIDILPSLVNLTTLYMGIEHSNDKQPLLNALSNLKNLHTIYYYGFEAFVGDIFDDIVVEKICRIESLHNIGLGLLSLKSEGSRFTLSTEMTNLEQILLYRVKMTDTCWRSFLRSVIRNSNKIRLKILTNDQDDTGFRMIRSSSDFTVLYDNDKDIYGDYEIECTQSRTQ